MAAYPNPVLQQIKITDPTTPQLLYKVPAGTHLGTLSVGIINPESSAKDATVWLLPAGVDSPLDEHLIHPEQSVTSTTSINGIATGDGYSIFVQGSAGMVFNVNGLLHVL